MRLAAFSLVRGLTLGGVLAILGMAACGAGRDPATAQQARRIPEARVALSTCRVEGVTEPVRCADVVVPEDRTHPGGRQIHLHVVVVPALGGLGKGVPLLELDGGPGVGATEDVALYTTDFRAARELGDVVLVDVRGTGASAPLSCPDLDADRGVTLPLDRVEACRTSLEKRVDLRHYGSIDAADDLDAVRAALGYDRVNLLAVSYGTVLAQLYIRAHGDRVGAAVFLSAVPIDARVPREEATNAQRALDLLVADCAGDAACARAFPALSRDLEGARQKGGDAFAEQLRGLLFAPVTSRTIPAEVHAVATSAKRPEDVRAPAPPVPPSAAVMLSVFCNEAAPQLDAEAIRKRAAPTFFGSAHVDALVRACGAWPRATVPPDFFDPVVAPVPVLVLAGDRDPATPPAYAERLAARMPRATLHRIGPMGHTPFGLEHPECIFELTAAFLRAPSAPLDAACIRSMSPPPFAGADPRP